VRARTLIALAVTVSMGLVGAELAWGSWTWRGREREPPGVPSTGAGPPIQVARPGLRSRATVTPVAAWRIGRAAVPDVAPASGTLAELGGKLVYVLRFGSPGSGSAEVIVDAGSGSVLSTRVRRRRPGDSTRDGTRGPDMPP
jgi:hypothetical protein